MTTITISREFCSNGREIARKTAQMLGFHFVDKDMIATILSQYGFVDFNDAYETIPNFWERLGSQKENRRELMVNMLNRVMLSLAYHGNVVILGRGSFAVLNSFADVLNVRIQAPLAERIKYMMERQLANSPEQAEIILKEKDKVRMEFIELYYGIRCDIAKAFDLVINTSKINPDLAVNWIIEANQALKNIDLENRCTTDGIEGDSILDSVISAELKCQLKHRS
jgi:cytidylate kinase